MATAAAEEPRKIDIGRVVSSGLQALGRNFLPFLGLALLLVGLPTAVAQLLLLPATETGELGVFPSPAYALSTLISFATGYVLQASIIRSAILDLSGRPVDIGASLALALKLLLPMIGLAFLTMLIVSIGTIFLIVPGVIAYLMLIVAVPALVEERRGVIASMRRSRELTKGSRGRIFLLLILFLIAYLLVASVIGALFAFVGEAGVGLALAGGVTVAMIGLLMAAMLASLYVELRTVKEGATTESLATIFE